MKSDNRAIIPYPEKWDTLGKAIHDHIIEDRKEDYLRDSFDLILGFTKGGHIIALVISSLLRDNLKEVYDTKKAPHKASVRPIPPGITAKRYRHPCFVMQDAASEEDMYDLRNDLIRDLDMFKKSIDSKSDKKLNILLVDDNITGSTRLTTFAKELNEIDCLMVKTLTYVRHNEFKVPELDYIIRDYPSDYDYFVMPWHTENEPTDITIDKPPQKIKFKLKRDKTFDISKLEVIIQELSPPYEKQDSVSDETYIVLKRGETFIEIKMSDEAVEFTAFYDKIYPPKVCLIDKKPGFQNNHNIKYFTLCSDIEELILHTHSCFLCAFLNCNRKFICSLFKANSVSKVTISPSYKWKNPEKYQDRIELIINSASYWFINFFPELTIEKIY